MPGRAAIEPSTMMIEAQERSESEAPVEVAKKLAILHSAVAESGSVSGGR